MTAEDRTQWWRLADGWQRFGIHTPMWRCGFCKADIRGTVHEDRGVCGSCKSMHKLDDRRAA